MGKPRLIYRVLLVLMNVLISAPVNAQSIPSASGLHFVVCLDECLVKPWLFWKYDYVDFFGNIIVGNNAVETNKEMAQLMSLDKKTWMVRLLLCQIIGMRLTGSLFHNWTCFCI